MDTAKVCQHCGKPLTAKAVQGICPECFMKVGLGTGTVADSDGDGVKPKTARFAPPPVEELAPRFPQLEIISLIGHGGMGAVYKARQSRLERLVALKILPIEVSQDVAFAERFTREARALARLSHPNIVAIHDFGQASGFYYFLMEFVDGMNLREMLRAQRLSSREAMAIVPQICEALQFAHDRGVVHRDIKPENILLDKQGRAKIADFGIAKMLGRVGDSANLTAEQVIGTPHYMAPEQVENPQHVDHRADIYSLGVVFYELLTGELPLGKFAPPSSRMRGMQMDVRLDEVVLRALEKEPARRYQHASEVKDDVETIAAGPARAAGATSPPPLPPGIAGGQSRAENHSAGRWAKRIAAGAAVALAVFIFFCVGAGALAVFLPRTYVATAKVMRDGPPTWFPGNDPSEIKSDMVLSRVATELGLAHRWAAKRGVSGALRHDEVIAILRNDLEVLAHGNSAVIEIRYSSDRPGEAAEIANKVAEASRWGAGAFRTTIIERAQTPSRAVKPNRALIMATGAGTGALSGLLAGALTMVWVGRSGIPSRAGGAKSVTIALAIVLVVAIPAGVLIALSALKFRTRTPTPTPRTLESREPVERPQSITNSGAIERSPSFTNAGRFTAEERLRIMQANRAIEAATPESAYFTGTFSNRYGLASHIASYPKKDRVLATLARDAAAEGDAEMVRQSLKGIVSFVSRDSAAHDAARAFAKRGMRAEALEVAKTITSFKAREDALTELSQ